MAEDWDDDYDDYDDDWGQEYDDDEGPCSHDCDDGCYTDLGVYECRHTHCFACGGCGCPGYCDDYQTYNLRPAETGGTEAGGG